MTGCEIETQERKVVGALVPGAFRLLSAAVLSGVGGMVESGANMTASSPTSDYVLGSTDAEHERLIRQAARLAPLTERLFREALRCRHRSLHSDVSACTSLIMEVFRRSGVNPEMGLALHRVPSEAGLPAHPHCRFRRPAPDREPRVPRPCQAPRSC